MTYALPLPPPLTAGPANPLDVAQPDGHFSQCIALTRTDGLLFISGQVPRAPDGSTVGQGDMRAQAEQVFDNLGRVLRAHGAGFEHLLKVTLYVARMDLVGEVMEARQRHYGESRPTSTLVGVATLGDPDWWLEVEAVAALSAHSDAKQDADRNAIRQTALDYIDAWYDGNPVLAERALHPALAKRLVGPAEDGRDTLESMSADQLIENCRKGSGRATPTAERRRDVTVLDVCGDAATVKVIASKWVDYLHLARIDGRWQVVNCLWTWT